MSVEYLKETQPFLTRLGPPFSSRDFLSSNEMGPGTNGSAYVVLAPNEPGMRDSYTSSPRDPGHFLPRESFDAAQGPLGPRAASKLSRGRKCPRSPRAEV